MHIRNKVVVEFICINYSILFIRIQSNADFLHLESFKNGKLYKQLDNVLKYLLKNINMLEHGNNVQQAHTHHNLIC
jgi:hypothetical protein